MVCFIRNVLSQPSGLSLCEYFYRIKSNWSLIPLWLLSAFIAGYTCTKLKHSVMIMLSAATDYLLLIKPWCRWVVQRRREQRNRWAAWREDKCKQSGRAKGGIDDGGSLLLCVCVCVGVSASPSVFSRSVSPLICVIIHLFVCIDTMINCDITRATKLCWRQHTPVSSSIQKSELQIWHFGFVRFSRKYHILHIAKLFSAGW